MYNFRSEEENTRIETIKKQIDKRVMINLITDYFRLDNISGIIFDKDGTLFTDSSFYWSEIIKRRSQKIVHDLFLKDIDYLDLMKVMGLDLNSKSYYQRDQLHKKGRKKLF